MGAADVDRGPPTGARGERGGSILSPCLSGRGATGASRRPPAAHRSTGARTRPARRATTATVSDTSALYPSAYYWTAHPHLRDGVAERRGAWVEHRRRSSWPHRRVGVVSCWDASWWPWAWVPLWPGIPPRPRRP